MILLVEDNPDDQILTRRALEKNNIREQVVVAGDGAEALDFLFCSGDQSGRNPDILPRLVLLDLKLPGIDGFEVLRRIRQNARTKLLPVVILTTSNEERDRLNGYVLGANSFIRKPLEFDRFTEAIRQVGLYWLVLNEPAPMTGNC